MSTDGHELRLAVSYLAPVVLTRALLPVLLVNTPARIVDVGSAGQEPLDFNDPELIRGYSGLSAYCRSKFALAAHTFALAQELAGTGVSVNVLHPATHMDTAMVREGGFPRGNRSPTARRASWRWPPGSPARAATSTGHVRRGRTRGRTIPRCASGWRR